ncbi:serendipity locus protein alpha isoform X1 [Lucilia sericata]|uniref:serendipity locus protein alpha isoform X1 n=1 Tax=Lucilia sericata TaxID=13632 RepID=UPI0018A81029|nr:serendipity locus protein alpha isoform X1 [Lucilia sericata]
MENCSEQLKRQLVKCRNLLNKGYTNVQNSRLNWLNTFCLEFLKFSQNLHTFLSRVQEQKKYDKNHEQIEIVYLCLTQIMTCIKHLENTLKAEERQGAAISVIASRQHFLDRINWCLERLRSCLKFLSNREEPKKLTIPEERSFVELMDMVLDLLAPYSSYKDESQTAATQKCLNLAENQSEAMFASQQIRSIVDFILSHTLAFANVALQQDKKALSALCQKVLRECMAFQEECKAALLPGAQHNDSNRKLKAISLENALYQLEDYINEALLRLVYTCFLDFNNFSIDKLRTMIRERHADDPLLDELIADFDVNVDRTTQIGIFAIAFAPNVKIKTIVRSCLASFESLDSCIIPSLQSTKGTADIFAQLLEQHFNEEVANFKKAIQEIIDSQAFASCYYELLTQVINQNDKEYNRDSLENIIKMAEFLYEHFQLPVNNKELQKEADRLELFKKFHLMLLECQAVLKCTTEKLEPARILKRFKILRSILRKFIDELGDKGANGVANKSQMFIMSEDLSDSQKMFASIGISPSIRSILYNNNTPMENRRQQRLLNDSLKANYSKLNTTTEQVATPSKSTSTGQPIAKVVPTATTQRASLRRKESLRTALFKRQKTSETEQIYTVYKNNSDSLQISEILDQLTGLSSNLSKHTLNNSIISN